MQEIEKYKRPAAAATVAVYAKAENSVLLIKRGHEPFKGKYAFPGGFLDVDKEDLYQTGVRELKEETGLDVSTKDLILVDVRSAPTRDPRGHTIDVGFMAVVDKEAPVGIEGDEAAPLWVPLDKVDKLEFAFDHGQMWKTLKAMIARGTYKK